VPVRTVSNHQEKLTKMTNVFRSSMTLTLRHWTWCVRQLMKLRSGLMELKHSVIIPVCCCILRLCIIYSVSLNRHSSNAVLSSR